MHNKIELILMLQEKAGEHSYDRSFQPFKEDGLCIEGSTSFILYGKRWTQQQMQQFVQDAVNHKIQVQNPETQDTYYQGKPFDFFEDFTIRGADFIEFTFIQVVKGKEYLFIDKEYKITSFASLEDKTVLNVKETAALIEKTDEEYKRSELKAIAIWKPDPSNFFNDFTIHTFANEHFKGCTTISQIDQRFREFSKVHHPDKKGDELMFKALVTAKGYLKGSLKG